MNRLIITAVCCALVSGLFGYLLLPLLRALKAGQSVRSIGPTWHNSKAGTPLMMGLMFIFGSLLCIIGNLAWIEEYSSFFVFALAACFALIGFVDDYCKVRNHRDMGLTALQKAMLQAAVSGVFLYVLYMSGILTCDLYIPFVGVRISIPPIVYGVFGMFVIVGCVNSVNLTDGVDGLSSSVTIPVMLFFTCAAVAMDRMDAAVLPAALVGGLLAFLCFNWHPAKAFMGDTGSLFLGGVVCSLAFALDMPLILIFVGFVYIVETLSDIIQVAYFKATHGKRFFKMAPIHHHFEKCGWKEEKIVIVFASVSAVMCLLGWFGISGRIG